MLKYSISKPIVALFIFLSAYSIYHLIRYGFGDMSTYHRIGMIALTVLMISTVVLYFINRK
ncbi:hypothetical protein FUAX_54830 (plasmid) [Fulvitalea axinellae]|uniref:Uncharacterized protein n=1 Tax=Fulvitalea axinellae TaxID=1182444 RepID=A0AAU9CVH0_9BACT|nr:hypothetical protein FUAX_54830 [Fulvitalea axinellae]